MASPFDLDLNEVQAYITNAANQRGIDPQTALRVWQSEGQGGYSGDAGTSFGPFQLHYGQGGKGFMQAGMGNDFTSATGLHASDPSTWKQQIDFALDKAKSGGWSPWYGAKRVGITGMQGIGGKPQPQMIDNAQPPPPLTGKQKMPWYPEDPQGLLGMGMNQMMPPQGLLSPQAPPQQTQMAGAGGAPSRWGSGSSIWPMLMGLGAGIAGGNGWGEGLSKGFSQAAVLGQQARENDIREKLLKAQLGPDIKTVKVGGQDVSARVYPDGRIEPVDTSGLTGGTQPLADFKDATSLRKEYTGSDQYKVWAQARPIYKTMEEASKRNSRASDVNMIYGLAKMFDPNSVVREGEMVIVKDTASLPEWLQGQINSLNGGAALGPETRAAVMTEARSRMRAYQDELRPVYDRTVDIAKRYGMPETDFGTKFEDLPEPPPAATGAPGVQQAAPGVPTQNAGAVAPQSMAPGRYRFNPQTGQVELVQ